jgi:redox-sensitive bicupin YhaK (pirin superfamily)
LDQGGAGPSYLDEGPRTQNALVYVISGEAGLGAEKIVAQGKAALLAPDGQQIHLTNPGRQPSADNAGKNAVVAG